jgi:hypothetical protein
VKIRQAITGRRSGWRLKLSFTFGAGQNAATQRNRRRTMAGRNTLVQRALCALSAAWLAIAPAGAQEIDAAAVAAYFDAAMAMERIEHPIAGAVVAVVRGDELIFSRGYGYAKLDADVNPLLHGIVRSDRNGIEIFDHGGDWNGFHSSMSLLPQYKLGVFISFNAESGATARTAARALVLEPLDVRCVQTMKFLYFVEEFHAALHAGDRRGCDTGRARCGLRRVNA